MIVSKLTPVLMDANLAINSLFLSLVNALLAIL